MRRIIALASLCTLASLGLPALATGTALASVSVPQPSCQSGLLKTTCMANEPSAPPTITWTLDGSSFSGSHAIKFGCGKGTVDSVSFSYVLSGVTYVSGTAFVGCESGPVQ